MNTHPAPCPNCGSDYLRIAYYPPKPGGSRAEAYARVECASCHLCGPLPPPEFVNDMQEAVIWWNDMARQWHASGRRSL